MGCGVSRMGSSRMRSSSTGDRTAPTVTFADTSCVNPVPNVNNPASTPPRKPAKLEPGSTGRRLRAATAAATAARRAANHIRDARQSVKAEREERWSAAQPSSSKTRESMAKLAELDVHSLAAEFRKRDENGDGELSRAELSRLLADIVGDDIIDAVDEGGALVLDSLLSAFDTDGSGEVDLDELLAAWRAWFGQAMKPVRCLLIIDVQNDFISGTLSIAACPAKQDGGAVVSVINSLRRDNAWDTVAVSLDWHPQEHCSFAECFADGSSSSASFPLHESQDAAAAISPPPFSQLTLLSPDGVTPMPQTLWPRHCVQHTWGSECHPDLVRSDDDVVVFKGTDAHVDSYSAFYDNQKLNQTALLKLLRARGVTHLFVTGLALDVCVAFSALHAAEEGFVVTVVEDACAGVSVEGIQGKMDAFKRAGITVARSSDIPAVFEKSSLDELTHAALRVRSAKSLVSEMKDDSGHGTPS